MSLLMPKDKTVRLLVLLPIVLAAHTLYDAYVNARPTTQVVDQSPGMRYAAPPYVGKPCDLRPAVGGWISPACVEANRIRQPSSYGLAQIHARRSQRYEWSRVGDDAVLSYCSWLGWCRVTAMLAGRFHPTSTASAAD